MQNDQGCFGVPGRASNPYSEVRLQTGNGYGSTNTAVRRYTTILKNYGSAITYRDDAILGATFTINEPGLYTMGLNDYSTSSTAIEPFFSVNSTTLANATTFGGIVGVPGQGTNAPSSQATAFATTRLNKGDVVRVQEANSFTGASTSVFMFIIKIAP